MTEHGTPVARRLPEPAGPPRGAAPASGIKIERLAECRRAGS